MKGGEGVLSPIDSLDEEEETPRANGVIKIANEALISQLTSNSPLPVYNKPKATSYK